MDDLTLIYAGMIAVIYTLLIYLLIAKRHVLMMKAEQFKVKGEQLKNDPEYLEFKERWFKWLK